jgi:hypothetical protein
LRDAKIIDLEKKIKQITKKKIDDIDIESFGEFAHFLGVLLKGLHELFETEFSEDDGELPENLEFLLDELQKELDQWIEPN